MKDEKLRRLCILVSVIGIVSLFVFVRISEPKKVEIGSLGEDDVGRRIKVEGTMENPYLHDDGHLFFHVKDGTGEINVVLFNDDLESMDLDPTVLKNTRRLEVEGDVELYEGELQVIPVEVKVLK
ncbi:MAG: exodeoxyribonuclease VII large subunit [Candidatus Aenigmatarchaeota archaeon]